MTVHIGSFGVARPQVDATFDYFGTTIRVHPNASDLAYTEFLAIARNIEVDDEGRAKNPADEQRAAGVVDDMLRGQVHPDDHALFMRLARENRQTLLDLMALSQQVISAVSGFPTGQPSDSSAGPAGGPQKSPGGSSSRADRRKDKRKKDKERKRAARLPVLAQPVSIADARITRATAALSGRPDLQLMVMRRAETIADSVSA